MTEDPIRAICAHPDCEAPGLFPVAGATEYSEALRAGLAETPWRCAYHDTSFDWHSRTDAREAFQARERVAKRLPVEVAVFS